MYEVTLNRFLLLVLAASLCGCSRPKIDLVSYVDKRVASYDSTELYEKLDAIEYFEQGGNYVNFVDDPEEKPFDEPYVVPLLKKLEDTFGFDFYVVIEKRKRKSRPARDAFEIIGTIPAGVNRNELQEFLKKYDETMPGEIIDEWGTDVLALDFFDEEEAAALAED